MKVGRPTKYDPKMCETVIKCMKEGYSIQEVAAELEINVDTFNEWRKNPTMKEFSVAVHDGISLEHAWWLSQGRINLKNANFNYSGYGRQLSNRFRSSDKPKVTVPGFADADTPREMFKSVANQVQSGKLQSEDISSLASLINALANAEEKTETIKRVDALEKKTNKE